MREDAFGWDFGVMDIDGSLVIYIDRYTLKLLHGENNSNGY